MLGHGIDEVYPAENRRLFARMREGGLLLSEFLPGEQPKAGNFPRRNRLIAALSKGVVVVEMGLKSGAQHTVGYALDQGREVFAVPGPINSPASEGTNQLLREGARIVTSVDDIFEELGGVGQPLLTRTPRAAPTPARSVPVTAGADSCAPPDLTETELRVFHAVGVEPRHVDQIGAASGLPAGELLFRASRPGAARARGGAAGQAVSLRLRTMSVSGADPATEASLPRSLYVHVPFCSRRCAYCDFAVEATREPPVAEWLAAVGRELELTAAERGWPDPLTLDTLYIGGGTPSLLGTGTMRALAQALSAHALWNAETVEWTCEANPESFTSELAEDWRAAGVNRISLGVQSFHEPTLRWMGRLHGPEGAARAVRNARAAGLHNLSVDLIFGLPGRLGRDWDEDLERALELEPEHVSALRVDGRGRRAAGPVGEGRPRAAG